MTEINYHTMSAQEYRDFLYNLIRFTELKRNADGEPVMLLKPEHLKDVHGNPEPKMTIGPGFYLNEGSPVYEKVKEFMGQAERGTEPSEWYFKNEAEARQVFDTIAVEYEEHVKKRIGELPFSQERAALVSLAWNVPANIGDNLVAAIADGNRAEAWYEIRYQSNKNKAPGLAKRHYYEAELFGLYDDRYNPTEAEIDRFTRTVGNHAAVIADYEALFGGMVNNANRDYRVNIVNSLPRHAQAVEALKTRESADNGPSNPEYGPRGSIFADPYSTLVKGTEWTEHMFGYYSSGAPLNSPEAWLQNGDYQALGGNDRIITEPYPGLPYFGHDTDYTHFAADSRIDAGQGDDWAVVGGGKDQAVMGPGNDTVFAGWGDDLYIMGPGDDAVVEDAILRRSDAGDVKMYLGGGGKDELQLGDGTYFVYPGADDDQVKTGISGTTQVPSLQIVADSGGSDVYRLERNDVMLIEDVTGTNQYRITSEAFNAGARRSSAAAIS